jgi:CTP:molybdopterin cytidylyltransferase MocA/5'-deoxynucleotidase YfbR-like HD superfamily hydrolase
MERLAAIVPAAGLSSRMGDFKPLLEIRGRTLLERALGVFRDAGVRDVVVVAGHRRDDVAAVATRAGARVVTNARYEDGMYSSLRLGVLELDPGVTRFFLLPADVPLVRPETIGRLARAAAARRAPSGERLDVVYPAVDGVTGHPPLISTTLRGEIRHGEPAGGLRELLLRYAGQSVTVDVDDAGVLLDADTPEDLTRLRERATGERLPDEARCVALLARRGVPRERIAHSLVVTAVAAALARALNDRRQHLVEPLVVAAALLHDIARDQPRHADAGADLVERLGYARVAPLVRLHAHLGERVADEPDEAQVVYLADKLVQGARVVGLEARFAARFERHAGDEAALAGVRARREEAQGVLRRVERVLGATLDEALPEGAVLEDGR